MTGNRAEVERRFSPSPFLDKEGSGDFDRGGTADSSSTLGHAAIKEGTAAI